MELRPYQREAVDAVYQSLRTREGHPAVCLPTGSGKSLVIAQLCADTVKRWQGRAIVVSHVQEILQQNAEKIRLWMDGLGVGIYSAGLGCRDTDTPVIVAGIQSVYRRATELGHANVVIIDEAHLLGDDSDSMYQRFLSELAKVNPRLRVVGLTATPFRLKQGYIYGPERMFSHLAYNASVKDLIREGFLCALISKAGKAKVDTSHLHVRAGEFVQDEMEQAMNRQHVVQAACAETMALAAGRQSLLVFAVSIAHAQHVVKVLREQHGAVVDCIFGTTPDQERAAIIASFRAGTLRFLVNVNVLTTGFDAPNVDCVVLLRPTLSPGLYCQMVGRGLRLAPGKQDCLVLDFAGNVMRHGPLDVLSIRTPGEGGGEAPVKECPSCQALIAVGYAHCPHCGHEFDLPPRKLHRAEASTAAVITGNPTITRHEVRRVSYAVHRKFGASDAAPQTLRVAYETATGGVFKEWICFEHSGYARTKAEAWWRARSDLPVPRTAEEAYLLAAGRRLVDTSSITIRSLGGNTFDRIIDYKLDDDDLRMDRSLDRDGTARSA